MENSNVNTEKKKALEAALGQIEKQYGKGAGQCSRKKDKRKRHAVKNTKGTDGIRFGKSGLCKCKWYQGRFKTM